MWARVVEVMLGCWLALSPATFERAAASGELWLTDICAGGLVICFALASFWQPTRRAHLAILVVATALVAKGFMVPFPPSAAEQNHILVGLLLMMFAIIPGRASQPPQGWKEFAERENSLREAPSEARK